MKRYQVTYEDCGEIENKIIRAEDFEHCQDRFWDWIGENNGGDDTMGTEIIEIKILKN
jgi:hypothetical protein